MKPLKHSDQCQRKWEVVIYWCKLQKLHCLPAIVKATVMLDFIQLGLAALFNMPPTAATRGQRGGGGCDGEMKHAGSQKKWRRKRREGERRRRNEGQRQKCGVCLRRRVKHYLWQTEAKRQEPADVLWPGLRKREEEESSVLVTTEGIEFPHDQHWLLNLTLWKSSFVRR